MSIIFMNSENNKTSDAHRLRLSLTDKMDFRRGDIPVELSDLSIYYTWKNIKKLDKSNKFKISRATWEEQFELPVGS